MKKSFIIMMVCVLVFATVNNAGVMGNDYPYDNGLNITCNGEDAYCSSVVYNNTHYVPLRIIFVKMGALVYYRGSDHQILALTRDGDMIRHISGSNMITVNGVEKLLTNSSLVVNNTVYIPLEMVTVSLCPDGITYENNQLNIQKQMYTSDYHKAVKDVMDMSWHGAFDPQKFQRYINYHRKNPAYGINDVVYRVNLGLDFPFYENISVTEDPYQLLVLVNKYNQLPSNFQQYNLVNMDRRYTVNDGKQYLLAGVAYEKYIEMADAAKKDGMSLKVVSAYRTESYQRGLYNNKLRTTGKVNADNYSARPGHSEHQTGLAVDINSTSGTFEYTKEFKWLKNHAHEYGFILRYQKGKEWITGYSYEPWHYRYVGEEVAKIIYEEGITYEEFYAQYIAAKEFK